MMMVVSYQGHHVRFEVRPEDETLKPEDFLARFLLPAVTSLFSAVKENEIGPKLEPPPIP